MIFTVWKLLNPFNSSPHHPLLLGVVLGTAKMDHVTPQTLELQKVLTYLLTSGIQCLRSPSSLPVDNQMTSHTMWKKLENDNEVYWITCTEVYRASTPRIWLLIPPPPPRHLRLPHTYTPARAPGSTLGPSSRPR